MSEERFHSYRRQGVPCGPAGPPGPVGGYAQQQGYSRGGSWSGFASGQGRFGEANGRLYQDGPVYDSSKILSEQHYHHGDHHHHHHQRHLHHFHDLHMVTEATETMDLRNTPQVDTRVIASENGPMEMHLRPDLIGQMVFDNGAQQYGFGVQYRVDEQRPASPMALGYGGGGYSAASAGGYATAGAAGGPYCGVVEEEVLHRRTSR